MLIGKLVKFIDPCVAKICTPEGSSDFIIEDPLTGIVVKEGVDPWGNDFLEVFAAGEILFDVEPDDVQIVNIG